MSVLSDVTAFADVRVGDPVLMTEPALMRGWEGKTTRELAGVLRSCTNKKDIVEVAVYVFNQCEHFRVGNEDEFSGGSLFTYNSMALFNNNELIDKMADDNKTLFLQAPERSGKTLQMNLETIIGYILGWRGAIVIGSPKDNAESVANDLKKNKKKIEKFVMAHFPKIHKAFVIAFGKDLWGPTFIFYDGTKSDKTIEDIKTQDNSVPVFSGTSLPPVKMLESAVEMFRRERIEHFLMIDEADSFVKPLTTKTSKFKAARVANILGMRPSSEVVCESCGDTHTCTCTNEFEPFGTYGNAKKIVLLSATMNLPKEYCSKVAEIANARITNGSAPIPRPTVMRPFTDRAIKLVGGVDKSVPITADGLQSEETIRILKEFFAMKNTGACTQRHEYLLDEVYSREGTNGTRSVGTFCDVMDHDEDEPRPFMPWGAEDTGKTKTNRTLLIQATHYVNSNGKNDDESDAKIDATQKSILAHMFGGEDGQGMYHAGEFGTLVGMDNDAVGISYFAQGAKMRFRNKFNQEDVSVKDIIRLDGLEDKIVRSDLFRSTDDRNKAAEILGKFKIAPADVENTMKFVSWYYGVHLPTVVIAYNKGQRAVDMCDKNHVITHMVMFVGDSKGSDSIKQQAGRCKAPTGIVLQCNFPADFMPTIVSNTSLRDAHVLEQLPFYDDFANGKRLVTAEIKNSLKNTNVLDKASKNYEPRVNMLAAIGDDEEVEEVENPNKTKLFSIEPTTIIGKMRYHLLKVAVDMVYTKDQMVDMLVGFLNNPIRAVCSTWIASLVDQDFLRINGSNYTINKNRAYRLV